MLWSTYDPVDVDGHVGTTDGDRHIVPVPVFHFGKCGPGRIGSLVAIDMDTQMVCGSRIIVFAVVPGIDFNAPSRKSGIANPTAGASHKAGHSSGIQSRQRDAICTGTATDEETELDHHIV